MVTFHVSDVGMMTDNGKRDKVDLIRFRSFGELSYLRSGHIVPIILLSVDRGCKWNPVGNTFIPVA